jgi:hypothetical protein
LVNPTTNLSTKNPQAMREHGLEKVVWLAYFERALKRGRPSISGSPSEHLIAFLAN